MNTEKENTIGEANVNESQNEDESEHEIKIRNEKVIQELARNYISQEKSLANQLTIRASNHHLTEGTYREEVWRTLFESIIPKKYCIEQGIFIIDSKGNISAEVDLAIFDEMYTPYIFNCGKIKFIPIEAVAIVVQCKSAITGKKEMVDNLTRWAESIDKLKTERNAVVRTMSEVSDTKYPDPKRKIKTYTQTSTRPIKILCGTSFSGKNDTIRKSFDILLYLENGRLVKEINGEDQCLDKWYYILNHYDHEEPKWEVPSDKVLEEKCITKVSIHKDRTLENLRILDKKENENVIMSLTFQLNQLLMIINNPMMFPHAAYVECFNKIFQSYDISFSEQGDKKND